MYIDILNSIANVYKQSPLFAITLPPDHGLGLGSAAWTPVAAEITRHTGGGSTTAQKKAVYAQVVAMLEQSWVWGTTPILSTHFSHADRIAFGGLVNVLLFNYRPLAAA